MGAFNTHSVLAVVEAEQERTARQVASLEAVVAAIVEGSELTSTDDEHDPEGATIAYERAQASALLRPARADRDALAVTRRLVNRADKCSARCADATSTSSGSQRFRQRDVASGARPDRRLVAGLHAELGERYGAPGRG